MRLSVALDRWRLCVSRITQDRKERLLNQIISPASRQLDLAFKYSRRWRRVVSARRQLRKLRPKPVQAERMADITIPPPPPLPRTSRLNLSRSMMVPPPPLPSFPKPQAPLSLAQSQFQLRPQPRLPWFLLTQEPTNKDECLREIDEIATTLMTYQHAAQEYELKLELFQRLCHNASTDKATLQSLKIELDAYESKQELRQREVHLYHDRLEQLERLISLISK
jgi:hypothetical protein